MIRIVGPGGAGKSTAGAILAERLSVPFRPRSCVAETVLRKLARLFGRCDPTGEAAVIRARSPAYAALAARRAIGRRSAHDSACGAAHAAECLPLEVSTTGGTVRHVIAVAGALAALAACGEPRDPAAGGQETLAFVMCQTPVTAQLRAPSTAEFPNITAPGVAVIHEGGGAYRVRGFVDAQNGLGAMIRTRWACEIAETPDHEWSLRNLDIEE